MAKGKYKKWLEEDNLILLECWARDGLTDEQIAHNMGINVATLYTYKNKYNKISEALKKGKEVVDYEVENALLKRALGFDYVEDVIIKTRDKNGNEQATVKKIKRVVLPDTTAQIFWLKNRKPEKWRDRKNFDVNAEINEKDPFKEMSKEELLKIVDD